MEVVLAYTAGLVDGEGSLGLEPHSGTRFKGPYLSVPSTTKAMIDWLLANHPGGIVSYRANRTPTSRPAWVWRMRGDKALALMERLRPYMIEPDKCGRVDLLLAEYKALTPRNGKYTPAMVEAKLDLERRVFEFNSRGQAGK